MAAQRSNERDCSHSLIVRKNRYEDWALCLWSVQYMYDQSVDPPTATSFPSPCRLCSRGICWKNKGAICTWAHVVIVLLFILFSTILQNTILQSTISQTTISFRFVSQSTVSHFVAPLGDKTKFWVARNIAECNSTFMSNKEDRRNISKCWTVSLHYKEHFDWLRGVTLSLHMHVNGYVLRRIVQYVSLLNLEKCRMDILLACVTCWQKLGFCYMSLLCSQGKVRQ